MKGREFVGQYQPVQAQDHQGAADVRPRSPYLLSVVALARRAGQAVEITTQITVRRTA